MTIAEVAYAWNGGSPTDGSISIQVDGDFIGSYEITINYSGAKVLAPAIENWIRLDSAANGNWVGGIIPTRVIPAQRLELVLNVDVEITSADAEGLVADASFDESLGSNLLRQYLHVAPSANAITYAVAK